ncbi:MAG: toll/interleukin-1 receptor domain-containing protein, partial [Prevotella sp.]|nr:toll/interleukin-1 receptor domain-containing protein [Prevotella sp.]
MENKDVFISYSRKDTEVANKICEAFDRAGITYFIDRQGIVGGMEFPEVLSKAICNCRLVLYLASNNSYASKFANKEILYAFLKKPSNSLLPYIIDNSSLPDKMEFMFADINWRNTIDHPIDTTLVDDICCLLGRERKSITTSPAPSATENAEELYKRGREYYDKGDYTSAVPLLSKAAAMGDADAQCNLGFC